MSKFSNYLRKLIDQSGESIASISRNAGIERTSIHKALKDERILSYKAMQILCGLHSRWQLCCLTDVAYPLRIIRCGVHGFAMNPYVS